MSGNLLSHSNSFGFEMEKDAAGCRALNRNFIVGGEMLNRVKELRKEKGLTQQKLAKEVGISRSAIAMYETGECDPSSEMLKTLSIFFDVSTDYVLCLTDIRKAPTLEEVSAMPEAQELRAVMESLSPEDRQRVLAFGRGLAATAQTPEEKK